MIRQRRFFASSGTPMWVQSEFIWMGEPENFHGYGVGDRDEEGGGYAERKYLCVPNAPPLNAGEFVPVLAELLDDHHADGWIAAFTHLAGGHLPLSGWDLVAGLRRAGEADLAQKIQIELLLYWRDQRIAEWMGDRVGNAAIATADAGTEYDLEVYGLIDDLVRYADNLASLSGDADRFAAVLWKGAAKLSNGHGRVDSINALLVRGGWYSPRTTQTYRITWRDGKVPRNQVSPALYLWRDGLLLEFSGTSQLGWCRVDSSIVIGAGPWAQTDYDLTVPADVTIFCRERDGHIRRVVAGSDTRIAAPSRVDSWAWLDKADVPREFVRAAFPRNAARLDVVESGIV